MIRGKLSAVSAMTRAFRPAPMASGKKLTAVEVQLLFLEEAEKFCAAGGCDRVVPHAGDILALYADTLQKLRAGDLDALAPRLDWVLKLRIIERAMAQRPSLAWDSPELKLLDHLYSSLDPDEGLYWIYQQAGVTESVASAAQIERFLHEPPEDTRAYARARLLRLAEPDQVHCVNWDSIGFKLAGRSGWPLYRTLEMADPLAFTKADTAALFDSGEPLEAILDALMHKDRAGYVSCDTSPLRETAAPEERLLLPAPAPLPANGDAAVANSNLVIQSHERFHEPQKSEGGQDDAAT